MKRYEKICAFPDIWIDEIPSHWETHKMKYLFNERSEKGHPDEPLLVASQNMGVVPKTIYGSRTVEAQKDLHLLKLVRIGDFVISLRSFQGGLEYAYYQGIISPAYTILIPHEPMTASYFRYLAKSKLFIGLLTLCVTGIREGQNIDYGKLRDHLLPVPPRNEQDQIVRYLDWQVSKINRLIAAKRKQIELMKDNLKSAVAKLTTHGIGSHDMCRSEIYWLTEYPSTWHVTKLKYILKKHRREVPPNAELLICSNSGEVTKRGDGKLGLVAASDDIYQGVKTGDLLIHGMDTWHGAIAISNFDGMCTPVVHVCTCREEKRFVAYYLKMMAYTKVFKAISNGVRQNTSDFRSWDKVGDLLICLPDISEQVAIADELDKLTDATKKGIACFERHIEKLVDLRTRLISDVVTGQIDVRGIEVPDYEHYDEAPENATEESSDSDYDTEE